uniref:Uncharacterized protein n=1 Tax=Cacopsylla melanoneura TaxID=428564 RepID=A0A8D9ANT9_9HEMI
MEHMTRKHKMDKDVKQIEDLDKKSDKRKILIAKLRSKATKEFNGQLSDLGLAEGVAARNATEVPNTKLRKCHDCGAIYRRKKILLAFKKMCCVTPEGHGTYHSR